jgi:hypothetical protein
MRTRLRAIPLISCLALAVSAAADVLETREGRSVEGIFRGATEQVIHFQVGGVRKTIPVAEVRALRFGETRAAAAAPGAAAPAAAQPQAAAPAEQATRPAEATPQSPQTASAAPAPAKLRTLSVPAGTRLRVRMADSLDARRSAVDDRFAAMLEAPLVIEGVTIAPAGSKVYGKVAEAKIAGPMGSQLKLELTELMISGQTLEILTGTHQLVEAAAANADPAKPAPAAEAPAPAADRIPGGTVLEFRLLQPFQVGVR